MKNITTRFITVDRMKYSIHEGLKYGTCISSIHPYDETEYHWAHRRPGERYWFVYLGREIKCHLAPESGTTPLAVEEVARELERLDRQAQLHRTGGIW